MSLADQFRQQAKEARDREATERNAADEVVHKEIAEHHIGMIEVAAREAASKGNSSVMVDIPAHSLNQRDEPIGPLKLICDWAHRNGFGTKVVSRKSGQFCEDYFLEVSW